MADVVNVRQGWREEGAVNEDPPPMIVCDGRGDARQERSEGMGRRGLAVRDREAGPGGQGDAEAWDGRVSRSGETGTPGQEYRRARAVVGWTGTRGRKRSLLGCLGKRKRKRDDGRRVCSAAARKNGVDCIPVAPARRDHGTWTPSR